MKTVLKLSALLSGLIVSVSSTTHEIGISSDEYGIFVRHQYVTVKGIAFRNYHTRGGHGEFAGTTPTAPKGFENNWVQTKPGKGRFVLFRFHGPTEKMFYKSWVLPDFEKVK